MCLPTDSETGCLLEKRGNTHVLLHRLLGGPFIIFIQLTFRFGEATGKGKGPLSALQTEIPVGQFLRVCFFCDANNYMQYPKRAPVVPSGSVERPGPGCQGGTSSMVKSYLLGRHDWSSKVYP